VVSSQRGDDFEIRLWLLSFIWTATAFFYVSIGYEIFSTHVYAAVDKSLKRFSLNLENPAPPDQ